MTLLTSMMFMRFCGAFSGMGGAAGLGDEVRMLDAGLVADLRDDFDDVGAIFRDGVVAGRVEIRVGAVVIDRHAAADVEHAHRRAFLDEIAIHSNRLGRAFADGGDVRDLRALVIVQHFQAADVAGVLELIDHGDDLRGIEAEDRFVTGAVLPVAGALGGKADADAEVRQDAEFARAFEDEIELAGHFQHEHDAQAHFLGLEGEVDEFLVLVAVADQIGLGIVHVRERGDELGLGAGFKAVVVAFAELGDLLDDLALLVDLDRIDAAVFAAVFGILDRLAERLVDFRDAGMEQIAETEEHRQVGASIAQAVDDFEERDLGLCLVILKAHGDMAVLVHAEEAVAPGFDTVELGGFLGSPDVVGFALGGFGGDGRRRCHVKGYDGNA